MGCAVDHKKYSQFGSPVCLRAVLAQIGRQLYKKKLYCNMLHLSISFSLSLYRNISCSLSLVLSVCTAAANAARHMDGDDDRLGLAARPLDGGGQQQHHHHTGLLLLLVASSGGDGRTGAGDGTA